MDHKEILKQLLVDYVSHIPYKENVYRVQKHNILHNFLVKYNPSNRDIIKFVEILCQNNETQPEILKRICS